MIWVKDQQKLVSWGRQRVFDDQQDFRLRFVLGDIAGKTAFSQIGMVRQKLIDAQPTQSMGKPEDIANAVSFLVSEKTNFITGNTLYVDGGKCIGAGI